MKRTWGASLVVAGALALSACAGDGSGVDTSAPVDSTRAPVDSVPSSAETFAAPLVGGGQFSLAAELSSRPVALWFWAPG